MFRHLTRPPLIARNKPLMTARAPPAIIHMERSVGFPVNVRETSEVKERASLNPKISRIIPSAKMASPTMFFMVETS